MVGPKDQPSYNYMMCTEQISERTQFPLTITANSENSLTGRVWYGLTTLHCDCLDVRWVLLYHYQLSHQPYYRLYGQCIGYAACLCSLIYLKLLKMPFKVPFTVIKWLQCQKIIGIRPRGLKLNNVSFRASPSGGIKSRYRNRIIDK